MNTRETCNIFLIGFMGCGKSTIASKLHRMYGLNVVEMDQMIVHQEGMSIPEIFERYGENHFRDLETELLKKIQADSNQVVSCGGGVVLREQNVAEMKKNGRIVLLEASPETILKRVSKNDNRPVLQGKKNLRDITELMEKRRAKYEAAADITVVTDGKPLRMVCEEIMKKIKEIED